MVACFRAGAKRGGKPPFEKKATGLPDFSLTFVAGRKRFVEATEKKHTQGVEGNFPLSRALFIADDCTFYS